MEAYIHICIFWLSYIYIYIYIETLHSPDFHEKNHPPWPGDARSQFICNYLFLSNSPNFPGYAFRNDKTLIYNEYIWPTTTSYNQSNRFYQVALHYLSPSQSKFPIWNQRAMSTAWSVLSANCDTRWSGILVQKQIQMRSIKTLFAPVSYQNSIQG